MPRLLFFAFLPTLIVLGHDAYLFIASHTDINAMGEVASNEERPWHAHFATAGFIWTQYYPAGLQWVARALAPEHWAAVSVMLGQKAVIVSLIPSGLLLCLGGLIRTIKGRP